MVKEPWPPMKDSHRSESKRVDVGKEALLKEMEELKMQNDRLRYQNEQSQFKLEQLSRQRSFDTDQLRSH